VKLLRSIASGIQGKCLCALGEFSTMPVVTGIDRFAEDFTRPGRGTQ
jgi:NADH-quinone oxidoreductase subunit F